MNPDLRVLEAALRGFIYEQTISCLSKLCLLLFIPLVIFSESAIPDRQSTGLHIPKYRAGFPS